MAAKPGKGGTQATLIPGARILGIGKRGGGTADIGVVTTSNPSEGPILQGGIGVWGLGPSPKP